jgi:hypothetical protein
MEVRTRDPGGSVDRIYGTIAKAASKNKFLDFRNALTLAFLEDYANLQGIGGGKHAPTSGIKLLIQDNSSGSQKAQAIVPCFLIDKILEVCRRNAADMEYDGTTVAFQVDRIYKSFFELVKGVKSACGHIIKQKGHANGPLADFGNAAREAESVYTDFQKFPATAYGKPYADFSYRQERVNPYSRSNDGYVRVSVVSIQRKQFNAKNEVMKSPWSVNISNFEAAPNEQKNGTTSYRSNTKRNEVNLFIQVSDDDMWRCCYAVSHFITAWELAYGIPLIQSGVAAYEFQQNSYRQSQNQISAGQQGYQTSYGYSTAEAGNW